MLRGRVRVLGEAAQALTRPASRSLLHREALRGQRRIEDQRDRPRRPGDAQPRAVRVTASGEGGHAAHHRGRQVEGVGRTADVVPRRGDRARKVSDRTLQRRLQAEGTSFQQLLDDTRRGLAAAVPAATGRPVEARRRPARVRRPEQPVPALQALVRGVAGPVPRASLRALARCRRRITRSRRGLPGVQKPL